MTASDHSGIPYSAHPRDRIHQGDIIQNLDIVVEGPGIELTAEIARRHFAIVLTQECDLEQDFRARSGHMGGSTHDKALIEILVANASHMPEFADSSGDVPANLSSVLLATALDANVARRTELEPAKRWFPTEQWKRAALNKDERYQVLEPYEAVHRGLLVDFKQIFSVSTDYLYAVLNHSPATFLCSMAVPYREHLSSRFSYFMSRVALPRDHDDPTKQNGPAKLPQ